MNNYYPFGMLMPERTYSAAGSYRYGFNGKENDNEVKGEGNQQDYGMRIYDPRVGRWFSVDPLQKKYPGESNYIFVSDNPILYKDADGREKIVTITIITRDGTLLQIQQRDKNYFNYSWSAREDGAYFRKSDVKQSLIIDLRAVNENVENNNYKDIIQFKSEDVNDQYIKWWEYSVFSDINFSGDNSDQVEYGYRIYGRGTDMEWQKGLPTAAPGTESIDMGDWFGLAANISPNSSAGEMFGKMINKLGHYSGDDMQQVLAALNIIVKNTEIASETITRALDLAERFKNSNKDLSPGKVICPTCNTPEDSTHVDDINGKGTYEKLKGTGQTSDNVNKNP